MGLTIAGRLVPAPLPYGQHYYGPDFDFPYNTATFLPIPTPIVGSEMMHPDVVDFGSDWNGGRYWMGATPYDGEENNEVPSVVVTDDVTDGGTWTVPAGYTNPAVPDPGGASHNADPDLIYDPDTDRLYMLYVVTNESSFQDIRYTYTSGGGTWATEGTVLAGAVDTYVNPSCIPTDAGWRLYYNKGTAVTSLFYRDTTTSPVSGYGGETTCVHPCDLGIELRQYQNVNVIYDSDGTICTVMSDAVRPSGGFFGRLRFFRSTDGGTTFVSTGPPVLFPGDAGLGDWDSSGIYRTSVLVDTDGVVVVDGGMIHVWYSAFSGSGAGDEAWGTAYFQLPQAVLGG